MTRKVFGRDMEELRRQVALMGLHRLSLLGDFPVVVGIWIDQKLTELQLDALQAVLLDEEEAPNFADFALNHQLRNVQPTVLLGVADGVFELEIAEDVANVMTERAYARAHQRGPGTKAATDWLPQTLD